MARILIVDDEYTVRYAMCSVLAHAGYEVFEAGDGVEALERLNAIACVDVAIIDIVMPNKDGVETIADISRRHPAVKIIAVSGGGGVGNFNALQSMTANRGVIGVLRKPFTDDHLLELIHTALADELPGEAP